MLGIPNVQVEEKVAKNVECEQSSGSERVVRESDDEEKNGENEETSDLDGFTANVIDRSHCHPVAGNGTSADKDDVSNSSLVELESVLAQA